MLMLMNRWLTAFIFAAQDYNWHSCSANAPPGLECSRKKANESFIFLSLYVHGHSGWIRVLMRTVSLPSSACFSRSSHSGPTATSTVTLARSITELVVLMGLLRLRVRLNLFEMGWRYRIAAGFYTDGYGSLIVSLILTVLDPIRIALSRYEIVANSCSGIS